MQPQHFRGIDVIMPRAFAFIHVCLWRVSGKAIKHNMLTKRQKTARERDDFCDFNEFWCGFSMVWCINKSKWFCAAAWKMSIFNRDIMTEWYHHWNKTRIWPYAIFSCSRSIHKLWITTTYFATFSRHNTIIYATTSNKPWAQIKKNGSKETIFILCCVCMRSHNHAFATVVCPILLSFWHKYMRCILSSLMSTSQIVFLLNFLFSFGLYFCFFPIVSCFA